MSRQSDRDAFIATMTSEGLDLATIRALLRAETTLHRLAELECSSEAADRDQVRCPAGATTYARRQEGKDSCLCRDYGSYQENPPWHGTVPRIAVKAAQTEARVRKALPQGFGVVFNGDPRGHAVYITVPSGATTDWGQRGIGVP
jgi:hypothetical protein